MSNMRVPSIMNTRIPYQQMNIGGMNASAQMPQMGAGAVNGNNMSVGGGSNVFPTAGSTPNIDSMNSNMQLAGASGVNTFMQLPQNGMINGSDMSSIFQTGGNTPNVDNMNANMQLPGIDGSQTGGNPFTQGTPDVKSVDPSQQIGNVDGIGKSAQPSKNAETGFADVGSQIGGNFNPFQITVDPTKQAGGIGNVNPNQKVGYMEGTPKTPLFADNNNLARGLKPTPTPGEEINGAIRGRLFYDIA